MVGDFERSIVAIYFRVDPIDFVLEEKPIYHDFTVEGLWYYLAGKSVVDTRQYELLTLHYDLFFIEHIFEGIVYLAESCWSSGLPIVDRYFVDVGYKVMAVVLGWGQYYFRLIEHDLIVHKERLKKSFNDLFELVF